MFWGDTGQTGVQLRRADVDGALLFSTFQTRGPLAIPGSARRQNLGSPEAFRSTEYAVLTSGMCDVHGVHSRKCNAIPADV